MFGHENFVLDLSNTNKAMLYKDGRLVFMGDGYRAITMLITNSQDPGPVREKFNAQLTLREKPKFQKDTDIDTLRKEAWEAERKRQEEQNKGKKRR